jgi:hypothetical protein
MVGAQPEPPMTARFLAVLFFLTACAAQSPFDNIAAMQQRLDSRGLGFGLARVPGHNAVVFQLRLRTAEADGEAAEEVDPMQAAQIAAPPGCTVKSVTPAADGLSFTAEYDC